MVPMKIHSFIKKGTVHPNYCEDYLFSFEISQTYSLFTVMDGCSSGIDAHFASALFGKIFKKIAYKKSFELLRLKEINVQTFTLSKQIIQEFWSSLVFQKGYLALELEELLSTFILGIYNRETMELVLNIAGDGSYSLNGQVHSIEQNNHPNYPAFHLSKPFEHWFENEISTIQESNISDFSISTDGIDSFVKNGDLSKTIHENPPFLFMTQTEFLERPNPLLWQFRQLEKEDVLPFDDFSIIRVINPSKSIP